MQIAKVIIGNTQSIFKYLEGELNLESNSSLVNIDSIEKFENLKVKYDLFWISPEKDRKFIKTEQIDPVFHYSYTKPQLTEHSYLIIWKSQALNSVSQNKLLKLIEEPPPYLKIYLCITEPSIGNILLSTIKSRTEEVSLDKVNLEEINEKLDKLVESMLSLEASEIKHSIGLIEEMLGKMKSNEEKRQLWRQFCNIATTKLSPQLTENPVLVSEISELLNKINKGVESNVNQKLLINFVFLSFMKLAN